MTQLPAILHSAAEEEITTAADWYFERNSAAEDEFLADLRATINRIVAAPLQIPRHRQGTRRALLSDFPYAVIFRVRSADIQILAVAHAKRRPGYWRDRLQ